MKFQSIMTNSHKVKSTADHSNCSNEFRLGIQSATSVNHYVHNGSGPMRMLHLRTLFQRVVEWWIDTSYSATA